MSALTDLPWLLPAEDFRQLCQAVDLTSVEADFDLRRLANHALDINQLNQLSRLLGRCETAGNRLRSLTSIRLALLGNGTLSLLVPALRGTALRYGIRLEVLEAPFGAAAQE